MNKRVHAQAHLEARTSDAAFPVFPLPLQSPVRQAANAPSPANAAAPASQAAGALPASASASGNGGSAPGTPVIGGLQPSKLRRLDEFYSPTPADSPTTNAAPPVMQAQAQPQASLTASAPHTPPLPPIAPPVIDLSSPVSSNSAPAGPGSPKFMGLASGDTQPVPGTPTHAHTMSRGSNSPADLWQAPGGTGSLARATNSGPGVRS